MTLHSGATRTARAFTLVELLVALTIASVLTLIALPALRNAIKQNTNVRSAELVRQVFINARAQAIKSGRPFGVALNRNAVSGETADYCKSLSFVTAPPKYRGDTTNATAVKLPRVTVGPTPDRLTTFRFGCLQSQCGRLHFEADTFLNSATPSAARNTTLRPGAILYFGESLGPFRLTNMVLRNIPHPANSGSPGVELIVESLWPNVQGSQFPFVDGVVYDFEMNGVPIESFLPTVELPRDSAIDLSISGFGLAGIQFNSQAIRCNTSTDGDMPASDSGFNRIVVLFGPNGDIQQSYLESWNATAAAYDIQSQFVSGTLYLALGRSDGILSPEAAVAFDTRDAWRGTLPNFASTDTVWISVRSSSGAVTSSPQVSPLEPAAAFYAANAVAVPPTGVSCANRAEQINVLSLRVTRGRQLAKQGALIQ